MVWYIKNYFMPINLITDKTNKFFESYKLPKLSQEEIDNINSHISVFKIKYVVKNFLTGRVKMGD